MALRIAPALGANLDHLHTPGGAGGGQSGGEVPMPRHEFDDRRPRPT